MGPYLQFSAEWSLMQGHKNATLLRLCDTRGSLAVPSDAQGIMWCGNKFTVLSIPQSIENRRPNDGISTLGRGEVKY